MIELTSAEYGDIQPLLRGFPQQVLPYAICQGINPGRIFADRARDPQVALIWSTVGYFCLAGDPAPLSSMADIREVLQEVFIPAAQAGGEDSVIFIPSSAAWSERLAEILPGQPLEEIYRRPFAFDPRQFAAACASRMQLPSSYRLQKVDASLAQRLNVLASWASIDNFLRDGMGFAVLQDGEVASSCTSVFASHQKFEIDLHTAPGYHRQGLASACAVAFIDACLQYGMQPNWECFWDNDASTALAIKLGFKPLADYPVYYLECSPIER